MLNSKEIDRQIAQGMLDGSKQAYINFSERFSGLIYKECMNYCTESEDTDDLLNETLIHLLITIGRFDPDKGSLLTWVLNVTRNFLRDYYRKNSDKVELLFYDDSYLDLYPGKQNEDIDESAEEIDFESSTDIAMLNIALSCISERDKSILQYRADGFSYENISEFLHIKAETARTAYCRAVKKVRERYNKPGYM
ncbi:MAG: sigma-70 family RNA polymerase sigma factor [Spirochaetes bacterium]|nr:sigma-70 family RNA polymerase sigma factor [Spirochaetota bacterium]